MEKMIGEYADKLPKRVLDDIKEYVEKKGSIAGKAQENTGRHC